MVGCGGYDGVMVGGGYSARLVALFTFLDLFEFFRRIFVVSHHHSSPFTTIHHHSPRHQGEDKFTFIEECSNPQSVTILLKVLWCSGGVWWWGVVVVWWCGGVVWWWCGVVLWWCCVGGVVLWCGGVVARWRDILLYILVLYTMVL